MRRSGLKTTSAKLRDICKIDIYEMAKLLNRSIDTLRSYECGRLKLSKEIASRMSRETGISPGWLLAGDTMAKPINIHGKPYKPKIYKRTQADKIYYGRPINKFMRNTIAAGFCARLIAIMEGSANFPLCAFDVHQALEKLRQVFGQDQRLYPTADVRDINYGLDSKAIPLLEELLEAVKQIDFTMRNYDALAAGIPADELRKKELKELEAGQPTQSKQPSKKKRRR
jgi:hypothetical protein